jgi:GH3 auxin-responsive promoter
MALMFNEVMVWLLKQRSKRIQTFMREPMAVQEQQFRSLLSNAKQTEWGKKYDYNTISSIKTFQERVPISTYEDMYPYIERVMRGEQYVLWGTPIYWFAKSSGTTNARSKYIPVSRESLQECHFMGGKDLMTLLIENKADLKIFEGKGISVGGSLSPNPYGTPDSFCGDVSAVIMKNLPTWAQYIRTPDIDTALMSVWEEKLERMANIVSKENVTSMLGVPTWILVLIEKILDITGKDNVLEIWPDFEVFVHGAVAFQPYRDLFKQKIFPSSNVLYLETYNASEGFFGVQDDLSRPDEMLLMLDYGIFYEFIPVEEADNDNPKTFTLEEVELGKNYAMIVSTNGGLWRYKIGDTVRFTTKTPYRIKISGRTKHFINAFGEEVIVENADSAIAKACMETGAEINDYTAAPAYMDTRQSGAHEWAIEFKREPINFARFVEVLDQTLRDENSDYDAKRYKDYILRPPIVHQVEQGTFYEWLRHRGKLGGQHKVPRLSNSREYLDDILNRVFAR